MSWWRPVSATHVPLGETVAPQSPVPVSLDQSPRSGVPGILCSFSFGPSALALRFFTPDHADDRVVIVNLGADISRGSFAEPLLAPPAGTDWALRWSSEDPTYGGGGTPDTWPDACWVIPGESTLVLSPGPRRLRHPMPLVRRRTA